MSVTASRLGAAPITLDWSNIVSAKAGTSSTSRLGNSFDPEATQNAWGKLLGNFKAQEVGFYDSPISNEISQAAECEELARKILASGNFTDCLFLGIGGSALGPLSLLASLNEKRVNSKIRFHVAENPDPTEWSGTMAELRPESTLVCIVTKSGTTFETLALALLALQWLGKERYRTHVVAITDPVKGDLKKFATQEGIPTLHIAPSIGGRFSIFSPVGLFPAALAGLSVSQLLLGAKQVRDYIEKSPLEKNALFVLGNEILRHQSQRPIHVCMPYSTKLRSLGTWFAQLWGESLGKDGRGFTPLAAVGATDQHSLLQLLRDGPDDKITFFLTVDHVDQPVVIPRLQQSGSHPSLAAFKILEGHTLHELLEVEYRATSLVLTKQGRPNVTWRLDRLDERTLGAVYYAFCVLTAFVGTLLGVNPFDQPGVEEGKVYIREALTQSAKSAADLQDEDDHSAVNRLRRDRS